MKREFDDIVCIEDVLRALIKSHGKDLYKKENASKLKSFLSDFAGKFSKERKVLNVVIDEGIQEKLLNINNGTNDEKHYVIVSCCQRLTEDIGFSENRAKEVVNILATGLGWKIPLSSFVESPESKQNISTDSITQDTEIMDTTPFVELINPTVTKNNADETDSGVKEVTAPVAGTVLRFCVGDGAVVTQGQTIAILESMKIELELKAVQSGKVHFVTPLGSHLKNGQTVATIESETKNIGQLSEISDLEVSINTVLNKKSTSNAEITSIVRKINELKNQNESLSLYIQKKEAVINAIDHVFEKFNYGSFASSCFPFWIYAGMGIITSIICFIKTGRRIISYPFLACFLGCIAWGFLEGVIYFFIDKILIRRNIRKVKQDINRFNKFRIDNFIIFLFRFIILLFAGGIIGVISAEFVVSGTALYGVIISSSSLILVYLFVIHNDWM